MVPPHLETNDISHWKSIDSWIDKRPDLQYLCGTKYKTRQISAHGTALVIVEELELQKVANVSTSRCPFVTEDLRFKKIYENTHSIENRLMHANLYQSVEICLPQRVLM